MDVARTTFAKGHESLIGLVNGASLVVSYGIGRGTSALALPAGLCGSLRRSLASTHPQAVAGHPHGRLAAPFSPAKTTGSTSGTEREIEHG